ncbi:PQ-loop-domain-containing protein [Dacryopinax primogenitus]|uniref:PQ-loop-domain-containing protein n=1 Tax=Dacryopinax primogenitus (strain DJM 731) TaxID=1858805 RepID=M5G079_DACPD|nr:PQ-loop-domain-containing protein [Dacryopinax primogenitus]EJU03661.1 PQ-loop-domain-containing protein [Dacryopinax primogenitus]
MPVNPVLENVFGTLGTVCWCVLFVPQAWKSWRDKSTYGLSPLMVLLWSSCALPLGVYNIASSANIPLILQPQLFGTVGAICWVQCLYYEKHISFERSLLILVAFLAVIGGLQVAFVFAVRHALAEGNERPLQFFGVMTVVTIYAGVIPQLYEIWKIKEVAGLSLVFMIVDILGGVFSTLSLVFNKSIDPLLAFSYISVIVLNSFIILLYIILNPLAARRRQREAVMAGVSSTSPVIGNSSEKNEGAYPQPQILSDASLNAEVETGTHLTVVDILGEQTPEEPGKEENAEEYCGQKANEVCSAV